MRLRLIIAQYRCRYPGEHAPNVVDAWDEYCLEENPEGYERALRTHQDRVGAYYDGVGVLDVLIPDEAVDGALSVRAVSASPVTEERWETER